MLMELFVPALRVWPALNVIVPFLGKASPSFTKNSSVGTPPSLSTTSTPIEWEAGMAPIVASVLVMIILLVPIGCSCPNSSKTLTAKQFSPLCDKGSEIRRFSFRVARPEDQPVSRLVNWIVYPFSVLSRTHITLAWSCGVRAVYLKDSSISVLIVLFADFLLCEEDDQSIDSAKMLAPSATAVIGFTSMFAGRDNS